MKADLPAVSCQLPVSLRVVSEARRAKRLHEHGVFARFRYNDLKEAAYASSCWVRHKKRLPKNTPPPPKTLPIFIAVPCVEDQ